MRECFLCDSRSDQSYRYRYPSRWSDFGLQLNVPNQMTFAVDVGALGRVCAPLWLEPCFFFFFELFICVSCVKL